jgi:PhoH-like ATPase
MVKNKKLLVVLDTSVLLYDKKSLENFENCTVHLPLIVLDELDRFKDSPGILGENARYINRFLDELRTHGKLSEGVPLAKGSTLVVSLQHSDSHLTHEFDMSYGDNRILLHGLQVQSDNPTCCVRIVTKDINLRVKADALGLEAEDYNKDYLEDDSWAGIENVTIDDDLVDKIYREKQLNIEEFPEIPAGMLNFAHNTFMVIKSSSLTKKSTLCRWDATEKKILLIDDMALDDAKFKPRNKEQRFAAWALFADEVKLLTITGLAGSGKTFMALTAAIAQIGAGKYDRLIITRNMEPVGRDIGFLPGTVDEKMAPWLAPIFDNLRCQFKDPLKFESMKELGQVEIAPLTFIRGRTFTNSIILVDESQNATIHELKTIITRVGDGSKIILLGDTDQIDTPYINRQTNGLSIVAKKMRNSKFTAHVHLPSGVRSGLATEASKIL